MRRRDRLAFLAHPAVVLGAVVVLGTLLSWRHTRHVHEWIVMTDELQYLKLGQSLSDGSFPFPTIRGQHTALLSVLYPVLIAPLLALLSAPSAYEAIHLLNALLIASTALPVYLIARQVVATRPPAYLAGALAAAVPWAATSAVVMTESAAYPAFAWALLAIQRAVAVPAPGRDLVAVVAIGVAFFARTQFVFLVAVLPAAIVVHEVLFARVAGERGRRMRAVLDRLRPHAALGALLAVALVLLLLPGDPLKNLLGPFQNTVFEGSALPDGLGSAMRTHLTYVAGGVGVLPLAVATGWGAASLVRPLDRCSHAFAALALVAGSGLLYVVAIFGLHHARGPLDRYAFYLAPLLIVGTVACLAQGRRRTLGLAFGAALAFYLLRSSGVQFDSPSGPILNSQASEFHRVIAGQTHRIGTLLGDDELSPVTLLSWGTLVATAIVALLLRRSARRALPIVGFPLLGLALVQTDYVAKREPVVINTSQGAINPVALRQRDWIDRAVRGSGDVALATSPLTDPYTSALVWWNAEFWNKRVNRAIILDRWGDYTPFPQRQMSLDERDGSIRTSDGREPRYMVFGRSQVVFRPRGRILAEYKTTLLQDPGLELLEVERPYRASWIADRISGDGWIVRSTAGRIRVFPRADGRAQRLALRVDLPAGRAPARFALRAGSRVARGEVAAGTLQGEGRVSLCLAPGRLRTARISTSNRARLPDGRSVGVHIRGIRVQPAGRAC